MTQATHELEGWHREAERALNARDYRRAHELCLRILMRAPDFADAFFLLGIIAAEHGNFAKAADVIARALRLDAQRADYHAQLSRCLIALNQPREALEAASRALVLMSPAVTAGHASAAVPRDARTIASDDALTLDTIGVVMSRAGAYQESLEPFRRAVALDSGKAAYFYNLGASLQFVGEFAAAEDAFREAIALDRNFHKAWSSLGQVSRQPFTAAELEHLESLLVAPDVAVEMELHICHALARHHEQQGDYSRSFQYLERGKRRKRASIDYSIETDRALFETAQRICSKHFLEPPGAGFDSAEPIFIVGLPRTGTTLVERILSSHPQVFAAGELTNFSLAVKRATQTKSNLVLDIETLEAASHVDLAKVGQDYLESTRPRTGHTAHFIDKMPLNFLYAGLIHRALPRAKIICLRRNPLDSCLSNYRQLFATAFSYYNYSYDLLDTGRYYIAFDALARHWTQSIPQNYCEVQYEAVVEDTEREARRLLAFCGLPWDPSCLSFHENAAPVSTASSVQVRKPIYRSALERWRKYDREIAPLAALLGEHGIRVA